MNAFVKVAAVANIPDPGRLTLEIDERMVILFRVGGQFYCVDDVCTHDGGPLGDGPLHDHCVVCPRHGAKFDIRDGKACAMPATEDILTHEVRVEGNDIYIRLSDQ
jgi:3-phenylpropionate/trans-cinnamate dioxygenase ferredoxin subunit